MGNYRAEIQNRIGCLFNLVMNTCFGAIFANLMTCKTQLFITILYIFLSQFLRKNLYLCGKR